MTIRVNIASRVLRGEPFEVRVQVRHPMETGYRTDESGQAIARNVIRTFRCVYDGEPVFIAQMSSGFAANPYLRFFVTARASGELVFDWVDDAGMRESERVPLTVT